MTTSAHSLQRAHAWSTPSLGICFGPWRGLSCVCVLGSSLCPVRATASFTTREDAFATLALTENFWHKWRSMIQQGWGFRAPVNRLQHFFGVSLLFISHTFPNNDVLIEPLSLWFPVSRLSCWVVMDRTWWQEVTTGLWKCGRPATSNNFTSIQAVTQASGPWTSHTTRGKCSTVWGGLCFYLRVFWPLCKTFILYF